MKKLLLVLILVALGLAFFGGNKLDPIYNTISERADTFLNNKEVNVEGLSLLTQDRIEELLPDKSNFWWLLNESEIIATVQKEPLVDQVVYSRCHWYSFSCYNLLIKERTPKFLYLTKGGYWLVGQDGGFIYTLEAFKQLSESQQLKISDLDSAILLIEDKGIESFSPNILKSRLLYVDSAIGVIEKVAEVLVKKVEILADGELEVYFEEFNFSVRFDVDDDNLERLKEESIRFKKLLPQLLGRQDAIKRIDLAFDKVGVIQLN